MRLLRFVVLSVDGEASDWARFLVEHEGVKVSALQHWSRDAKSHVLVAGVVNLPQLPATDDSGVVEVPDEPRKEAESAIEIAADAVSVATGHGRTLSSPRLPVAFEAENDDERAWLTAQSTLATAGKGKAAGRLIVAFDENQVLALADREAGVALMSEALGQTHLTGRLRVLLLLFEQAFATAPGGLANRLVDFLAQRPGLDFSKAEVKAWAERYRGRAMHADRRPPLIEADVRPIIDRVLFASYDVLLNKLTWGTPDARRRDVWTPSAGPLDRDGRWFVRQHSAPTLSGQIYDAFDAYPLALDGPAFTLSKDSWPRETPVKINAPQPPVEVVRAERLAVTSSDR